METKICINCKIEKELSRFSFRNDTGKYKNSCASCESEKQRIRRAKGRVFIERPKTKEWEKGDREKIYISPSIKKMLKPLVFKLCNYCRAEINKENTSRSLLDKGYCSEWCEEIENPPEAKKLCVCGNAIGCYYYKSGSKKGQKTSVYPKFCEECQLRKPWNAISHRNLTFSN